MSSIEPLCSLLGIDYTRLSTIENNFLEAELFARVCAELKRTYRKAHRDYYHIMRISMEVEDSMLETNFIRSIINDILSTQEYTLQGIATYTDMPEDVIEELASGCNTMPSAMLMRRVIELHRVVRPHIYDSIKRKIIADSIDEADVKK